MSVGRITKRTASLIHQLKFNDYDKLQHFNAALAAGCRAFDVTSILTHAADQVSASPGTVTQRRQDGVPRSDIWLQATLSPSTSEQETSHPGARALADLIRQVRFGNAPAAETPGDTYLDAAFIDLATADLLETLKEYKSLSTFHSDRGSTPTIRSLGVSNVTREQIEKLNELIEVKPGIVSNDFTADTGYDDKLRSFCRDKGVVYQCHGVVTGNEHLLSSTAVQELAMHVGILPISALYAFIVLGLNVSALVDSVVDGLDTKSHLEALAKVRLWKEANRNKWMSLLSSFKGSLSRGRVL